VPADWLTARAGILGNVQLQFPSPRAYRMSMPASRFDWTVDMLDALPDDGNRYEIIDGELFVTPAPSNWHQHVVGALYSRLRAYLRPFNVARAMLSPSTSVVRIGIAIACNPTSLPCA
jgi:hypothetical protein